jgi:pentatricopeptide repeat protein
MKRAGIAPNEVIYTSLMTSAERLVKMEKNRVVLEESHVEDHGDTKAIEVYTELMKALMDTSNGDSSDSNTLLMKVFLVFQEMKTAGAQPDLACYNALLRACARAGDVDRALEVMRRLQDEGLHPNDKSWRELVRAAAKVRRSDLAEAVWSMGKNYPGRGKSKDNAISAMLWKPSVESLGDLVNAYLRESHVVEGDHEKRTLLKKIIVIYRNIMTGSEGRIVDKADMLESQSVLLMMLQAIVALEKMEEVEKHKVVLKNLGRSIAALGSMERIQVGSRRENNRSLNSLRIARAWLNESERAS